MNNTTLNHDPQNDTELLEQSNREQSQGADQTEQSPEQKSQANCRRESRVVVITGASAGIGRATVKAFAQEGVCLGLIARDEAGLNKAKWEVERAGGQALVFPIDMADAGAVEHAAQTVEETFGPIDVWVNNAMVSVFSPIKDMYPEEYRRVTEVTYLGYVHGTLAALKRMSERNRGTIVQVSSALAHRSIPLQSAYCAAKHAIKGFTESLLCELSHDKSNVKVSMVAMPAVNTPQFDWVKSRLPRHPQPVPPIYQPEVAAKAIVWAAKNAPRELLVGSPTIKAVWGEKFIPAWLDKYLGERCYDTQQTRQPISTDQPDNLWQPLTEDYGSHGDFDANARSFSFTLWLQMNKKAALLSAVGLLAAANILGTLCKKGR